MIKNQTDAIADRNSRRAGVYHSHGRGSKKNYTVYVPDYDHDRPDRIIPLIKLAGAKEAQDYYEVWVAEHKRQYEERLKTAQESEMETETAKMYVEVETRQRRRETELKQKYDASRRLVDEKSRRIESLEAITSHSEKAFAREKERGDRLQAEVDTLREMLKEMKRNPPAKETGGLPDGNTSRERMVASLRKEINVLKRDMEKTGVRDLTAEIEEKSRRIDSLEKRVAELRDEIMSERHGGDDERLRMEKENEILKNDIQTTISRMRTFSVISGMVVIVAVLFSVIFFTRTNRTSSSRDVYTLPLPAAVNVDVSTVPDTVAEGAEDGSYESSDVPALSSLPVVSDAADSVTAPSRNGSNVPAAQMLTQMSGHLMTVISGLVRFLGIMLLLLATVLLLYTWILRSSGREERQGDIMKYVRLCLMGGLLLFVFKAIFL